LCDGHKKSVTASYYEDNVTKLMRYRASSYKFYIGLYIFYTLITERRIFVHSNIVHINTLCSYDQYVLQGTSLSIYWFWTQEICWID